ncbi:hypothetical protein BAZ12_08635 [Elizabethkingia miricola]|uniref:hypothetical protein n=1 Tax=Bacteroidota TaxID=976 RepID=UPI000998E919|nr:hypothetical protein [Elizabethkingia miricola]OPC69881.1 hypothetical protein BAZ12_08635 [Elizabethkingia miricola]
MNTHIITLFNDMAMQNMHSFSRLPLVKSLICADNINLLTDEVKQLSDFYVTFLQKIGLLPDNVQYSRRTLTGTYDFFYELRDNDPMVKEVLYCFTKEDLQNAENIVPIHVRYFDSTNLYLASGFSWTENGKKVMIHLSEFSMPKRAINMAPSHLSYLVEILNEFDPTEMSSIREIVAKKGLNYNRVQKDSKIYWGDTFYSFFNKIKMIEAVGDIIFTRLTLKEIAFRNKFSNYINMHRTFLSYGISLSDIPRLANH